MVFPLYKVISLVIRVASKPLINYTKQVHLRRESPAHPLLRTFFIRIGNGYNRLENMINRKFMKIETQFAYRPLSDETAIEKGIQFFYQIVFYSIVIGFPLYEMHRASEEAKEKREALDHKLTEIDGKVQRITEKIDQLVSQTPKEAVTVVSWPEKTPTYRQNTSITLEFLGRRKIIYDF